MKGKLVLFSLVILLLPHFGLIYAQQGQGPDNKPDSEQSSSDSPGYMGGKEHYLADSPDYMAGKKHYLPAPSIPSDATTAGESKQMPAKSGETKSGESEKSGDQEKVQIQVEINVINPAPINYGIIVPAIIKPGHRGGHNKPSPHAGPNAPDSGDSNPNFGGNQITTK